MSARKRNPPRRSPAAMRAVPAQKEVENPKPMDQEEWWWPRYRAKRAGEFIESRRVLFERSRNPVHAMEAYRITRIVKIDIPEWVLEVFDQWADVLCVKGPKGAKKIADALGLGIKGGGPSITAQAKTEARDWWIAERVLVLREDASNRATLDVFNQVAEEYSLSSERVAAIWYELANPRH